MYRRDVLRGTAAAVGTASVAGARRTSAHEGSDGDGDGSVAGDPSGYAPLGVVDVPGAKEAVVGDESTAYLATGDGYAVVDISDPTDPRVLDRRTSLLAGRENGPLVNVQDVSVDGDTLVVAGPAHPRDEALSGLLVVDVSDPTAPRERGFFSTDYPVHNCTLADGRAYLTANDGDRNALVVVDVRDAPAPVGTWSLLDVDEDWGRVSANRRTLHDVTVHGGVAVCAHWDAGTWLVDVSDPTAPRVLGSVDAPAPTDVSDSRAAGVVPPGNHHYATLDETGTLLAVGKETFAVRVDEDGDGEVDRTVGGPSGVDLWDVSDPTRPVRRSTVPPPTSDDPTLGGTWTTAHNLDLRAGTLYTSWYRGGVKRHDVSDPSAPVEESWWLAPEAASFWTARAVTTGTEGFFVASSRGVDDVPGRLYTFPDRPGTSTNGSAVTAAAPPTDGSTQSPGPTATAQTDRSPVSAPGFGALSSLAALAAAGWLWRGRLRKP